MKRWIVTVAETRNVQVEYVVEAEDAEEAADLALSGETIEERPIRDLDVIDRHLLDTPEEMDES